MIPRTSRRAQWPLLIALLSGLAVIVGLWFAIAPPLATTGNPAQDSRYLEGIVGQPQRINPLFTNLNDADRDIASLIFSGLSRLGPSGEVLPDLAQSWQVSSDGLTYTFNLRPGVIWQDGQPFSAADVIFTYSLLADRQFPGDPELGRFWQQVQCQEMDRLTVRCQLPAPFAPFLSFTTIGILPKHVLEGVTAADLFDHPFNRAPIGTGPFRLQSLTATHAILVRNAAYHLGPPRIGEVELRFYPDEQLAMTALHGGEIQGLLLSPAVSRDDLNDLLDRPELRLYPIYRTAYTVLYLNDRSHLFSDPRVRRALAYAIDRDTIIGTLLEGRAIRADSPIAPGTWAYNPNLDPISFDRARARRLLEEAGWKLEDNSTVRQKQGVQLRFSLLTDADPLRTAIAQEVAGQLKEVGIAVSVTSLDVSDLVRDFLVPRQYQAAIFGWDPGYDPDPYPAWHSSQTGQDGRNLANYVSEQADKILEDARKTTSLDQRQALYYTFQLLFIQDVPSLPLYYPIYNYFVHRSVKGIALGTLFDPSLRFANIHEWTIEPEEEIIGP